MVNGQLQMFTAYSLLASTNRIKTLVQKGKERGYEALAITDLNVLSGVVEFYNACRAEKIKPLIGLTLEYCGQENQEKNYQLILLAKNLQGYQNLLHISSLKMTQVVGESFTLELFAEYLSDLVIIFPGNEGEVAELFGKGQIVKAQKIIQQFKQLSPTNHLYAGAYFCQEKTHQANWLQFCAENQLPLVALQDVRYLDPSDEFSLSVLRHLDEGTKMAITDQNKTGIRFLPSAKEMASYFENHDLSAAYECIQEIVDLCQVEIPLKQKLLPHYSVPADLDAATYLRQLCFEQLPKRVVNPDQRYQERLEKELTVIHEMGFDDYFLIVWDVMDFAHRNQIVTGAGRGSAAGSLVSYLLAITEVDPIRYDLLFERFLNKERNTMPDIDLDIPDNRRDEVLHYVWEKYGHQHMAQISTFGTLAAKMVLRDVARVFGLSQNEANVWSKAIPNTLKITLSEAYKRSPQLQKLVSESEKNRLLFETAQKLEGLPRHVSTHAAGVVISDEPLTQYVPLQAGANKISLTQFTMGDVEAVGLLKMDFLGLRNLSIMDHTLKTIKKVYKKTINLREIPLDDPKTLALFQRGDTTGVFQFESNGIRSVLRRVKPTSIEDIAAVNALYRPGPMQNIDLFVQRKHGKAKYEDLDPSLRDILAVTYGVMVYQEQIMQVAVKMAGYTLGEADLLQRAVSKKKQAVLDHERTHFVKGALERGHSEAVANKVYDYIERFGNYGFNRSHAVAYSFIGYQMAYLKVHYPAAFFTALLHSVRHNMNKMKEYSGEAKRFGVSLTAPAINQSQYSFALVDNHILYGLSAIKGIRRDFAYHILTVRQEGLFRSMDNFLLRIDRKWLKEDYIEPLILTGAFDQLDKNRKKLKEDLKSAIDNIVLTGGSEDLLNMYPLKEHQVPDYTLEEKLNFEEQYTGIYLSGHPIEEYQALRNFKQLGTISQIEIGKVNPLLVYVKSVRTIRTKKGEQMAFVSASDLTGEISVTLFPKIYRKVQTDLQVHEVYYVEGKVEQSTYNQELQILAERWLPAKELAANVPDKTCYLKIAKDQDETKVTEELKTLFLKHKGNIPIVIYYEKTKEKRMLNQTFWVEEKSELIQALQAILGNENVVFRKKEN